MRAKHKKKPKEAKKPIFFVRPKNLSKSDDALADAAAEAMLGPIVKWLNERRAEEGLPPLVEDDD